MDDFIFDDSMLERNDELVTPYSEWTEIQSDDCCEFGGIAHAEPKITTWNKVLYTMIAVALQALFIAIVCYFYNL